MSKYWTSEKLIENVTKCQQLFGHHGLAIGFEDENRIAMAFAAARVQSIYGGTSEVMKEIISRTI
jgi:acyl-CoA dehydrogenase